MAVNHGRVGKGILLRPFYHGCFSYRTVQRGFSFASSFPSPRPPSLSPPRPVLIVLACRARSPSRPDVLKGHVKHSRGIFITVSLSGMHAVRKPFQAEVDCEGVNRICIRYAGTFSLRTYLGDFVGERKQRGITLFLLDSCATRILFSDPRSEQCRGCRRAF